MSAEIASFEQRDSPIVDQATHTSATIQIATGISEGEAYSNRGAEYAVKITLAALRRMGLLVVDIDEGEFVAHVTEIESQTLPAREWRQ